MRLICLMIIFLVFISYAGIPCYPPEYYAPEKGAPYRAEEVTVYNKSGQQLVGTLTIPKDVYHALPGVVLITGSSPQNRNHSPAYTPEYRLFRQIADALSLLAEAIRYSGNQDVTVKIFHGYNHGFINFEDATKKEKAGKPVSEILTISSDVINFISDWSTAKLK